MSKDPHDAGTPLPFDVFRNDGSTRLPAQRFPQSEVNESVRRNGPVDQRVIVDASGGPVQGSMERATTVLRGDDRAAEPAAATEAPNAEPLTIRLQTYQLNLAERIARVKAEQQEAIGNLRQLEADSQDTNKPGD